VDITNRQKGSYGEHLVLSKLFKMGMNALLWDGDFFDLIFYSPKDPLQKLFKVQVKTAEIESRRPHLKNYSYKVHYGSYKRRNDQKLKPFHADLLAYVAFDIDKVFFEPTKRLNVTHRRIKRMQFDTFPSEETFEMAMKIVRTK
jgi:hypothetical protein